MSGAFASSTVTVAAAVSLLPAVSYTVTFTLFEPRVAQVKDVTSTTVAAQSTVQLSVAPVASACLSAALMVYLPWVLAGNTETYEFIG